MSEVGSPEYWHERFSRCLAMLEETQAKLRASEAETQAAMRAHAFEADRAMALARDLLQSRENEATEARRVDELLQDSTRARNETLAALEKLETSEAEVARLESLFQCTQGVGVHHSWVAKAQEATRLEAECERLRREVEAQGLILALQGEMLKLPESSTRYFELHARLKDAVFELEEVEK